MRQRPVPALSQTLSPLTVLCLAGLAALTGPAAALAERPAVAGPPRVAGWVELAGPGGGAQPVTGPHEQPSPPADGEAQAMSHVHCENGFAGPYPCRDVDVLSVMPRSAIGAAPTENLNDIWGWTDSATGHEYALVGREGGTSFVDVTDPEHPVYLGTLQTRTFNSAWRDLKVYRDHVYVVADGAGPHGVQVFDLRRLRGVAAPTTFQPDAEYLGPGFGLGVGFALGSAHNIAIDEDTGFAYVVGSGTCSGGLHMLDLSEPARPRFAGCYAGDGYTHDLQCVVYHGPDGRFGGHELCFAANEDTLTVVDVTDKGDPVQVARVGYPGSAYSHQCWLTEDHRYLLLDDELDELSFGHGTRTRVWDVRDVARPQLIGTYTAASTASDHNLYVRGRYAYLANYSSGLRVLDLAEVAAGRLTEVAYFDVEPGTDAPGFIGAWSSYPFFASGTVVVSGIGSGLFVLRPFPADEHDAHPGSQAPDGAADPQRPPVPPGGWIGPRPGRPSPLD